MEDFVPYELLCKLREKGYKCKDKRFEGHIYDVLKWLRKEKKIYIAIDFWPAGYDAMIYIGISEKNNHFDWEDFYNDLDCCETPELAAITRVEYCLDNLI